MSGITASLPKTLIKNSVIGAMIALICYAVLQLFGAWLIYSELVGEDSLYLLVCVSAALSSFAGCGVTMLHKGKGGALSASVVVVVFLVLTLSIGFMAGDVNSVADGFVGIGLAMAAGGLLSAFIANAMARDKRSNRDKGRSKKRRR